jgi:ABC-type glycerol-3-phosphate transport system substrate-binding protein
MHPEIIPSTQTFVIDRLIGGASGYGWSDPAKPLAIMGYGGTWVLNAVYLLLPKDRTTRYGFFRLPPMVGTEHKFVQNSGWAFAVPKTSKNQRVAWDIAKSIALSPEAMQKWSATTGALPALIANGSEEAARNNPLLAQVQPLLASGRWVGYIPAGAIETVEGAILSNFFAAARAMKTIDQALADMQQTANQALASNR